MATMRDVQQGGGLTPAQMLEDLQAGGDVRFDEGLFERLVDRQRVAIFGGETPEGELSGETRAMLEDHRGQAGAAGQVVNAAVEACVAVLQGAEQAGVEVPPAEGLAAGVVAMMDVAEAADAMGRALSPEEGVQAMYATLDNLVKRGVNTGVWDQGEAEAVMASLMEAPEEFEAAMRAMDPEGAAVMEGEGVAEQPEGPPAASLAGVAGEGGGMAPQAAGGAP